MRVRNEPATYRAPSLCGLRAAGSGEESSTGASTASFVYLVLTSGITYFSWCMRLSTP